MLNTSTQRTTAALLAGALLGVSATVGLTVFADGDPTTDAVPRMLPYQGVLELNGQPVNASGDQALAVRFDFFDGPDAQTPIYSQDIDVEVFGGRFTVSIGPTDRGGAPLSEVIRAADDLHLGMTLLGDPNTPEDDVAMSGRQRILASPYAMWSTSATNFTVAAGLDVGGPTILRGGLDNGGQPITHVAQPTADADVVTKAHLKAMFNNTVIYVRGATCPTGFVPYATAEGRFPRGQSAGNQSTGGISQVRVITQIQQSGSSGYAKTGPVGIQANGGGEVWASGTNDVQGSWSRRNSGWLDITPPYVNLKPCVFNPSY